MVDLPAEVWTYIGSFSLRQDLVQLALVSRAHLALMRPLLAEDITLRLRDLKQSNLDYQRNLQFLVDSRLSTKIKSFRINGSTKYGAPDIPFDAMPNLRSLTIDNCGVFNSNKQKQIVHSIRESCAKLRTIKVSSAPMFPHKGFSIPNIVNLEWSESSHLTPALFSLCQASLTTIAHMSIRVLTPSWFTSKDHHEGIKSYKRFFRLRFPALSSLEIGPGHESLTIFGNDETNGAFTKFLLAHPTLEKLVLPHWEHPPSHDDVYLPVSAKYLVGPNSLPALRYFEAHPRLISELLEEDAHFLIKNVETLLISEAVHPDYWDLDESNFMSGDDEDLMPLLSVLYRLGESQRRTLAVTHLIVHLSKMNDDADALDFTSGSLLLAADSLPNLESWVGSIPVLAKDFAPLFCKFPRIRTITGSLGLLESISEDSVRKTAIACKFLDRVDCLVAGESFIVARDEEPGGGQRIHIRQQGRLPHFCDDGPECRFMMDDAMYRISKGEGCLEDGSEDWSLGNSDDD